MIEAEDSTYSAGSGQPGLNRHLDLLTYSLHPLGDALMKLIDYFVKPRIRPFSGA
jgi:hypothetical protein